MQKIWKMKEIGWDDVLPPDECENWFQIFKDLERLNEIRFERSIKPENAMGIAELHVFGDASICAYGACAYMLWPTPDGPCVRLVGSKSRVAPLRQVTIPRLELMAALLASRLARTIYSEMRTKPVVTLWSDSQIVLHWLHSESTTKKAFVGVRVAEIQSEWDQEKWKYVPTKLNPAD